MVTRGYAQIAFILKARVDFSIHKYLPSYIKKSPAIFVAMDKLISSAIFIDKYLKALPLNFQWQKGPLQVYPLSFLTDYFRLPIPLVRTNYNFLFYLREGDFLQQIDNEAYQVKPNAIVFISAGTASSLKKVSKQMKGYFILIEEELMPILFGKQQLLNLFTISPVLQLNQLESDWIFDISKLLFSECSMPLPNMHVGSGLIQALLHKVVALSEKSKPLSRTEQIAIAFKQSVHKHFRKEKSPAFYAGALKVSENYLNRCVKALYNKSSKEIILEIAILYGQIQLWDVAVPINEICYALNFDDPSYFSRLFKKVTGYTPSAYRNMILHNLS